MRDRGEGVSGLENSVDEQNYRNMEPIVCLENLSSAMLLEDKVEGRGR